MEKQTTQITPTSIHPGTHIGPVTLRVADLERSLSFYRELLGFRLIERSPGAAILGAQDSPALLELREVAGAPPQPLRSTGLYHVAILLPGRADLGRFLRRVAEVGWEIGQGDHLVSEALYLSDPDGNGLEVYRDRPRESWRWSNGMVQMATDPIDLYALMDEGKGLSWDMLPAGTRIGHIHLRVGDIHQAEHFYHTILGFDITASLPSALFLSAGGYHHHIGLNTWQSRGAGPAPEHTAGLQAIVIELPNQGALLDVRARLLAYGIPLLEQGDDLVVTDPWRNHIRLMVAPRSSI
jgi:catechol 2,3-dioxygenase